MLPSFFTEVNPTNNFLECTLSLNITQDRMWLPYLICLSVHSCVIPKGRNMHMFSLQWCLVLCTHSIHLQLLSALIFKHAPHSWFEKSCSVPLTTWTMQALVQNAGQKPTFLQRGIPGEASKSNLWACFILHPTTCKLMCSSINVNFSLSFLSYL